jgi:ribonuclease VapC
VNEDDFVADASAILAALKNEPFGEFDPERLVGSSISTVNLCEVLTKLQSDGLTQEQAVAAAARLNLQVVVFDAHQAGIAADLWPRTRQAGLSLGDRACLALGLARGRPVVTADRVWATVDVSVEIVLIR